MSVRSGAMWVASLAAASLALAGAPVGGAGRAPQDVPRPAGAAALRVYDGHPRLIVGGWRGASAADLRRACAHPEMAGECDRIGGRHLLDDAMRYVLDEDERAATSVRSILLAGLECGDGYEQTPAGGYALAYDWVWPALSAEDRGRVEATLAACGTNIARSLRGNAPHLWHGYSSQAAALALVALSLDGPGRDPLLADAVELFRGRALEAYSVTGGAWPEGYSYLRTHFFSGDPPFQYVLDALRAWHSAIERDTPDHESIFDTIAHDDGDWLRGLAYHVVYGTLAAQGEGGRPTLLRTGDMPTGQAYPTKQVRPYIDAIARIYDDARLRDWGEALEAWWPFVGGEGTYHPIHRYALPYGLPVDVPSTASGELARGRIWGRADLGYVVTRSWWGPGETVITYRAGKWFTGHQHMDQGHLDIWHMGPLAVDAGVYAAWGSEHREAYYSRTVAHNALLVRRPGETFEQHPSLSVAVNDDGQRVHTHNRRGCAQCMQSVAEWRANVGDGLRFEAGRIDAFEDDLRFTVVESDLTAAYNSSPYSTPGNAAKVASVQRDLLFVRPWLLLVVDRLVGLPGSEPGRFVLHLPARPDVSADLTVLEGSGQDGVLAGTAREPVFAVTNDGGGTLIGRTVLPSPARVTLVGGPEHRYWVDGANRAGGSQGLEGDPAEPGTWRIEAGPPAAPDSAESFASVLVHALTIGDPGVSEVRVASLPVAVDPAAPEAVLGLWAPDARLSELASHVLLMTSGTAPRSPLRYAAAELPAGPALLVLVGAAPGAAYRAAIDGHRYLEVAASQEGVAWMLVAGGALAVGRCPPPPTAGQPWLDLCTGTAPAPTPPAANRAFLPAGLTAGDGRPAIVNAEEP